MSRATYGTDRRFMPRTDIDIQTSIKVKPADRPKLETGMKDFDDVLGGGLTLGACTILGGDPGAGKSTLLRQMSACAAKRGNRVLYCSTDEHPEQARAQMDRLNAVDREVFLSSTPDFRKLIDLTYKYCPRIVVVDMLQDMYDPKCKGAPGRDLQLNAIMALIKQLPDELAFVFVGQTTKSGQFAGSQKIKHKMDQLMWIGKSEMDENVRPLTLEKNRWGTTNVERLLIMGPKGFCNYGKDDPRHENEKGGTDEE